MKKVIITLVMVFAFSFVNAQDTGQTAAGKWLIEANTNFGVAAGSNTGFSYSNTDGDSEYNIGAEVGYFVIDDLAIKGGLGYGGINTDLFDTNVVSYKIGLKYYILSMIPVQVDYSGGIIEDLDEDPSYFGVQAGYAIFLGSNVSVEPGIRYNISLNEDYSNKDTFQFNIGFVLHF
ncbi:outer membrane beta-barrel protein [Flavobacterium sinopsychrotolerans]|jgi:hypothetical protein|uniref:Outer membrane protein beta-barrel domain-containing protein n=1 Tax=Flavobacterium sinopsychrotolerans TaxID=604089 RepID=A0A1H8NRJ3_9FLAO|nr:outer membrane beta-barrel protein [Flavobacterium sinopsychrotolerans]SEO31983.1 hypothetical protein SAMN04487942_2419 [Flavobacterium sinopsychrotolerans]